jgi:hypothetical protein
MTDDITESEHNYNLSSLNGGGFLQHGDLKANQEISTLLLKSSLDCLAADDEYRLIKDLNLSKLEI